MESTTRISFLGNWKCLEWKQYRAARSFWIKSFFSLSNLSRYDSNSFMANHFSEGVLSGWILCIARILAINLTVSEGFQFSPKTNHGRTFQPVHQPVIFLTCYLTVKCLLASSASGQSSFSGETELTVVAHALTVSMEAGLQERSESLPGSIVGPCPGCRSAPDYCWPGPSSQHLFVQRSCNCSSPITSYFKC